MFGGLEVLLGRASEMRGGGWGGEVFADVAWPGASLLLFPELSLKQLCPQGPSDCRKQCGQDYYLDQECRCVACVSCEGKTCPLDGGDPQDWVTTLNGPPGASVYPPDL